MREIGASLIDIHGQHEHQELMNESLHLSLLDQFGGNDLSSCLSSYGQVYKEYLSIYKQLDRLNENEQEMAHRLDLIQFQLKEIHDANLQLNEDEELQEEKRKLMNFERLFEALQTSMTASKGKEKGWTGQDWR